MQISIMVGRNRTPNKLKQVTGGNHIILHLHVHSIWASSIPEPLSIHLAFAFFGCQMHATQSLTYSVSLLHRRSVMGYEIGSRDVTYCERVDSSCVSCSKTAV